MRAIRSDRLTPALGVPETAFTPQQQRTPRPEHVGPPDPFVGGEQVQYFVSPHGPSKSWCLMYDSGRVKGVLRPGFTSPDAALDYADSMGLHAELRYDTDAFVTN